MPSVFVLLLLSAIQLLAASPVWKVSHGESELYIGGTIHLLRAQDFPLPNAFDTAYNEASLLVFETDPALFNRPDVQKRFARQLTYQEGESLEEKLSPDTYKRLRNYWKDNRLDPVLLDNAKPMLVMLIMLQHELNRQGTLQDGVDNYFYSQSLQDDKKTAGLVGIDEHLELFTHITADIEDLFILSALEEVEKLSVLFETIVQHWRKGDTASLFNDLVGTMEQDAPQLYEKLLTARNHQWLFTIESYLRSPAKEFVLVGAAHLLGEDGLLQLLKAKGYRIEQLP